MRLDPLKSVVLMCLLVRGAALAQSSSPEESLGSRVRSERLAHTPTDERIVAAEHALQRAPADLRIKKDLLSAYLQKVRESGDYSYLDRASRIVDQIFEQDSSNTAAAHFQSEIDLQRHRFTEVAERALGMTKYDPSDAANWANLGDASMELGQYEQAGSAYLRMYALRTDLASYNRLAWFRFVTGDGAGAIDLMRQAVEAGSPLPENTAWCEAELGDIYFKLGRLTEARQSYEHALLLFPKLHRAMAGLGRVETLEGHPEKAIPLFLQAQAIIPLVDYAGALYDLYAATGNQEKASGQRALIEVIDKLARAGGEKTNRNLAIIYADHAWHMDRATELIEAELPVRGDVYTWDAASWVYFRSGQLAAARVASAKAMHMNTPEPMFYDHAEKIAAAIGDDTDAAKFRARLAALHPGLK